MRLEALDERRQVLHQLSELTDRFFTGSAVDQEELSSGELGDVRPLIAADFQQPPK